MPRRESRFPHDPAEILALLDNGGIETKTPARGRRLGDHHGLLIEAGNSPGKVPLRTLNGGGDFVRLTGGQIVCHEQIECNRVEWLLLQQLLQSRFHLGGVCQVVLAEHPLAYHRHARVVLPSRIGLQPP